MNNKASITALMSSFGRAFHTENEEHPVFRDFLAKELMTAEEYTGVQNYILGGVQFFEPEIVPSALQPKELLRKLINTHIAPSPLCLYGEGSESCHPDRYKAICHPWRRYGHLCLSGAGVFIEVPGIRGRSSSDAGRQAGTNHPRRLDDSGQSHLCPGGFHEGQLDGTADRRRF